MELKALDARDRRPVILHSLKCFLLCMTIAGCASVPLATPELDADAKRFSPADGRSTLYVVRAASIAGSADVCQVAIDQKVVGGLAQNTYHAVDVAPGDHTVTVHGVENEASITLPIERHASAFIEIQPSLGWRWRWTASAVTDKRGRELVNGAKRAAAQASVAR